MTCKELYPSLKLNKKRRVVPRTTFPCAMNERPISEAARSKAWVYGLSLAGIVGSNPAGEMDVCVECCVFSGRGPCDWLITRSE